MPYIPRRPIVFGGGTRQLKNADLRYQFLPWWWKLARHIRHTPIWYAKFIWYVIRYYLGYIDDGPPPRIARSIFRGCRDAAMKHYYTQEEVMGTFNCD